MATTWNSLDNPAGFALSNGNLTASNPNTTVWDCIRGTNVNAYISGKLYFEVTVKAIHASSVGHWRWGIANGAATLENSGTPGADANMMVGILDNQNNVFYGFAENNVILTGPATNPVTVAVNDVWGMAIDLTNSLVWAQNWTQSSGWTGVSVDWTGDPAAGTQGASFAGMVLTGGVMPLFGSFDDDAANSNQITLNTAAPFVGTIPSGFSAWDTGGGGGGAGGGLLLFGGSVGWTPALRPLPLLGAAAWKAGEAIRRNATLSRRKLLSGKI